MLQFINIPMLMNTFMELMMRMNLNLNDNYIHINYVVYLSLDLGLCRQAIQLINA